MLDEERFPIKAPTEAQQDYAADLVRQLREAQQFEAERYARAVERCYDRRDMSRFIGEMKVLLEEIKELDRGVRFPKRRCDGC
jgi:polyhydroxyalkanoate synthesis regulator phasin